MAKTWPRHCLLGKPSINRRKHHLKWLDKDGVVSWIKVSVSFFFAILFSKALQPFLPSSDRSELITWLNDIPPYARACVPLTWCGMLAFLACGGSTSDHMTGKEEREGSSPIWGYVAVPMLPLFRTSLWLSDREWRVEQDSKESSCRTYCGEKSSGGTEQEAIYLSRFWKLIYPMVKNPM